MFGLSKLITTCSSSLELRQPRRPLVVRRRGQRSRSPLKALSNQWRSWPARQLPVQRPAHQPPKVRTGILYDSLLRTTTFWLVNWTRFIWGLWIPPQHKNNQQTKSKISWNKLSTDFKFLNHVFFFLYRTLYFASFLYCVFDFCEALPTPTMYSCRTRLKNRATQTTIAQTWAVGTCFSYLIALSLIVPFISYCDIANHAFHILSRYIALFNWKSLLI